MTEQIRERYDLTIDRIGRICMEKTVGEQFREYFQKTAEFILEIERIRKLIETGMWKQLSAEEKREENRKLYEDILPEQYAASYANPAYAVQKLGEEYGRILSFLYTEIRGEIIYAFEQKDLYLTICNELFIEIYNCFESVEQPVYEEIKEIVYWYASDYADVFVADRVREQIDPSLDFATTIIMQADLSDSSYLYDYGEYVSDNEKITAEYLNTLPEETIQKMADTYTEGYRICFVNGRKDLSKKKTVNVRYPLGFERMMRRALENFEKMGLQPVIFRNAVSVLIKGKNRTGYYGGVANSQYEFDHQFDQGLFLDKKYVERKLEVMKSTYENHKELARGLAGPAVLEGFGDIPFAPVSKPENVSLTKKQEQLEVFYAGKAGQLVNEYVPGDERGFTIISFPLPAIGEKYEEIFDEVIRINTLDSELYGKIQQNIIDVLDRGTYVHVEGKGDNKTDLDIQLYPLKDPSKETIFENCVADCNIPVGEVFTSPVLKGTNGTLHVSKVFLHELQYQNLEITFEDGMIKDYTCTNFDSEEENKKYVFDNVLYNHDTLPIGEFAIGTNTTAYVMAQKYGIEDKLTILIAEKMGPHFAVGDTCYSWSEDVKVYNPNGKEIVARDNEVSILRKEDVSKAYYQCHTDITIPYEELAEISVVTEQGEKIMILQDGRFVVPGTEKLNEPFQELN